MIELAIAQHRTSYIISMKYGCTLDISLASRPLFCGKVVFFLRECKVVHVRINLFTWGCEWSKQKGLRAARALRARSTEEVSEFKRPWGVKE